MADRLSISDARADGVPVSLPGSDHLRLTEQQPARESTGSLTHNDSDTESEKSGARPVRVKR